MVDFCIIAGLGIAFGAGDGQLGTYIIGVGYFKPYTMDSNILASVMALMVVIYTIINRHDDSKPIPRWLLRAYLTGTTCLVLTFIVVAAFLAPTQVVSGRSYWMIFSGDMFFFHFLNPLLSVITLVFLLKDNQFTKTDRFIGMIPTIIYSIVYFVMVVVLKQWEDFYHFTFGGKYYLAPVVLVAVYGVAFLTSFVLTQVHNQVARNCK